MLLASQNSTTLNSIKEKLKYEFKIKDLGPVSKILGMENNGKLFLTQRSYVEKAVKKSFLNDAKSISLLLSTYVKLSIDQSPKTEYELKRMMNVPYANVAGYEDVCHNMSKT